MTKAKAKRQKYVVGSVVKVPIDETFHTYAMVLELPLLAFYDAKSEHNVPIDEIISRDILFQVWVMKYAVTSGQWQVIGVAPVPEELQDTPYFFKQDPLSPSTFCLYRHGQEYPATRDQCRGLERAAVWDPEHVEERLRDYYAGVPNQFVERFKP